MDEFLARAGWTVRETVDARKERYGRERLGELLRGVRRLVAIRRGKATVFDLGRRERRPDLDEVARAVLGPSGNLRAPAARAGDTLLVGFDEEIWRDEVGG